MQLSAQGLHLDTSDTTSSSYPPNLLFHCWSQGSVNNNHHLPSYSCRTHARKAHSSESSHPQILLILPSKYWSNLSRSVHLRSHKTQAAMIFHLASSGGGIPAQFPTFADFYPSLSHLSKCKCDLSPMGSISEAFH